MKHKGCTCFTWVAYLIQNHWRGCSLKRILGLHNVLPLTKFFLFPRLFLLHLPHLLLRPSINQPTYLARLPFPPHLHNLTYHLPSLSYLLFHSYSLHPILFFHLINRHRLLPLNHNKVFTPWCTAPKMVFSIREFSSLNMLKLNLHLFVRPLNALTGSKL